jgi:hypothetical protein
LFAQKEPLSGIVQILKGQGHKASYVQVSRFIKERVRSMGDPDRQDAGVKTAEERQTLDLIASASLRNACMRVTSKAKMLSRVAAFKEKFNQEWALRLFDAMDDQKELSRLAGDILLQCFKWATAEVDWMRVQRHEREVALKAVEAKLKFAKELKGQAGTKIIVKRKGDDIQDGGPANRKVIQFKVKKDG